MEVGQHGSDRLIDDYLREIRVAAWNRGVSRARVGRLVADVRAKIEAALSAAGGGGDEAIVYGVLDRLGPPSAFVAEIVDEPRSGVRGVLSRVLAPLGRLGYVHGWGLVEIGALLLLIAGPFALWWLGPIFGIILVRVAADRWSAHATHRATNFVVALFAVQGLIAIGLLVVVMLRGDHLATQMEWIFEAFNFAVGQVTPLPHGPAAPLSPSEILLISPAFIAGIASGIYLALSPRRRPT